MTVLDSDLTTTSIVAGAAFAAIGAKTANALRAAIAFLSVGMGIQCQRLLYKLSLLEGQLLYQYHLAPEDLYI
ncbi:hypothetical protein KBY79_10940 [Synechococcus lacustris C3-12m-Tous]|uniref:hypothetical protein n=1 Tax=Synechococcus lacustris TaxID=2116544 RepID=UPI0020CD90A3|nr:hypothetical protein [Synechococcus lacustris]MCP9925720.1 hypothetical protein [Synechococcus lacustris C3-12m-Tous]